MHTHKNYNYVFLLEFWNCSCNTNFLPLFPSAYKTHHISASCYDETSAQNVFGLTLVLCIVFIADFFPSFHVESTEVKQFRLRLRVIGRNIGTIVGIICCRCCFLHIVVKLKHKTYLSDILLKCRKF